MFYTAYGERTDVLKGKSVTVRVITIADVPNREAIIALFKTLIEVPKLEIFEGIETDPRFDDLLTKYAKELILNERSKPSGSLVYANLVATHIDEED